jgi:hypothetical protein
MEAGNLLTGAKNIQLPLSMSSYNPMEALAPSAILVLSDRIWLNFPLKIACHNLNFSLYQNDLRLIVAMLSFQSIH